MQVHVSKKSTYISEQYKSAEFALFDCVPRDRHSDEGKYII